MSCNIRSCHFIEPWANKWFRWNLLHTDRAFQMQPERRCNLMISVRTIFLCFSWLPCSAAYTYIRQIYQSHRYHQSFWVHRFQWRAYQNRWVCQDPVKTYVLFWHLLMWKYRSPIALAITILSKIVSAASVFRKVDSIYVCSSTATSCTASGISFGFHSRHFFIFFQRRSLSIVAFMSAIRCLKCRHSFKKIYVQIIYVVINQR